MMSAIVDHMADANGRSGRQDGVGYCANFKTGQSWSTQVALALNFSAIVKIDGGKITL